MTDDRLLKVTSATGKFSMDQYVAWNTSLD